MNIQRMKSSHEKFPVQARRDAAHKMRNSIVKWSYDPKATGKLVKACRVVKA